LRKGREFSARANRWRPSIRLEPKKLLPGIEFGVLRIGVHPRTLVLTSAVALCGIQVLADSIAPPQAAPVRARLLADMHARKLTVGATVYARVIDEWRGSGCELRSGAILEGHVVSVTPYAKPAKTSAVDLAFTRAQCLGKEMGNFNLLLAGVAAPPQNVVDLGVLTDPVPTRPVFGDSAPRDGNVRLTSNLQSAQLTYQFVGQTMHVGDVQGIKGLKLSVGTGLEDSSVLSTEGHDLSLEERTLLVLVPTQRAYLIAAAKPDEGAPAMLSVRSASAPAITSPAPVPASPGAPAAVGPAPVADVAVPAKAPADEVDLCEPPQCVVALPSGDAVDEGKPESTISIRQLGYAPRPEKLLFDFDHDEALAWLGPHELLVTFNPHTLVPRHSFGPSGSTVRLIRAVTVDTNTHQVTHTADWELPDDGEFLWRLDSSSILVHVGAELRVYGAGLKLLKRISLNGPLAFVRVTPDGSFIVVGLVRERHTPELHARLEQSLNDSPEEDVEILVLNRKFTPIAQSTARTSMMPPTLLNEGQARLTALPDMRYRITLLSWDNNSSLLARFDSSCAPQFTSLAPDLIFLVSCRKQHGEREYRVLRSSGKLVVKGRPAMFDCGHSAAGSASSDAFVIKTVQSAMPISAHSTFNAAGLSSEELSVYRATDGKRLLGVRVASPSPSRDNYALAPDGAQLAVLSREQISVYSVPSK
jgi:hypothetical protein